MKYLHILIIMSLLGCSAKTERTQIGFYTEGFEWSTFIACGSKTEWWVDGREALDELKERLKTEGVSFSYTLGDTNPVILTKFRGSLSEKGSWGHLGKYEQQLNLTEYLEHGEHLKSECDGLLKKEK